MNIEDLKSIMDAFDPASLLPEMESILNALVGAVRLAILAGPIVVLAFGVLFLVFAPKEANYYLGYRCAFGMGSVEAWRFTQRLAGITWTGLGLALTVVMFILTRKFGQLTAYDVVWTGVKYILWEVGLVAVSSLFINTAVMTQFTYDGELRRDRR